MKPDWQRLMTAVIALLLTINAALLFLILTVVEEIESDMPPYQEACGSSYSPCQVEITRGY